MRRAGLLSLALTTLCTLSACGERKAPDPVPPSDPELGAALLSIYFQSSPAELRPTDSDLEGYEFMPLDRAARILAAERGAPADYRRRQAIVKLSVANFQNGEIQGEHVLQALNALGAPLDEIENALSDAGDGSPASMEPAVYQALQVAGFGADCAHGSTTVGYDPWNGTTLVAFSVTGLQRDFDELAVVLDPQNWAQCSAYFKKSFVARQVAGEYPLDPNGNAEPASSPPSPGTTWDAVLFEYFDFSHGIYEGWFKNLLTINAVRTSDQFFFQYGLHQSILAKFGWLGEYKHPLTKDGGYMSLAKASGNTSEIHGLKIFQYKPLLSSLNWLVPIMLYNMGDEARTIACTCQVPVTEPLSIWEIIWEWFESWWPF